MQGKVRQHAHAVHADLQDSIICLWGPRKTVKEIWDMLQYQVMSDPMGQSIVKIKKVEQSRHVRYDIYCKKAEYEQAFEEIKQGMGHCEQWIVRKNRPWEIRSGGSNNGPELSDKGAKETRGILCWNVRSIKPRKKELRGICEKLQIGVVALQETRRKQGARPFKFPGMEYLESAQVVGQLGRVGVMLCISKGAIYKEVGRKSDFAVFARINDPRICKEPVIVASVYIPCLARDTAVRVNALKEVHAIARDLRAKYKDEALVLMGDFNMEVRKLNELMETWGLGTSMLPCSGSDVTRPGKELHRLNKGRLDHMIGTKRCNQLMTHMSVMRRGSSDHWPIVSKFRDDVKIEVEAETPVVPRRKMDAGRVALKGKEIAEHGEWKQLMDGRSIKNVADLDKFVSDLLQTSEQVAQELGVWRQVSSTVSSNKQQFLLCRKSKTAIEIRQRLHRKWRMDPGNAEFEAAYRDAAVRADKLVEKDKGKSKGIKIQQASDQFFKGDTRAIWNWVREMKEGDASNGKGEQAVRNRQGVLQTNPKDISDAWADHFGSLAADSTGKSRDFNSAYWSDKIEGAWESRLPGVNGKIVWSEVNDVLLDLAAGKACGADGLIPEWFKTAGEPNREEVEDEPKSFFGKAIWTLCRKMFKFAHVSEALRDAVVVAIPKKDAKPDCMDDYRGISLISIALKIVITLVAKRISKALEETKRIIKEQAGFRTEEECMGQVCALFEIVKRRKLAGLKTFACFIDFKKAYDMVPHAALMEKLKRIGLRGKAFRFVESLYRNSTMRVRTGHGLSKLIELLRGVRQGCPASTILFDVFINDILEGMGRMGVDVPGLRDEIIAGLLFADDLVLLATSEVMLQAMMDVISIWGDKWSMAIGAKKCGVMAFFGSASNQSMLERKFTLQGEAIPVVNSYTYLGVVVKDDLVLNDTVQLRKEKTLKLLHALRSFFVDSRIPAYIRTSVLRATVIPTVTYGGELFGMQAELAKSCQSMVNKGLRWIIGVGSKDNSMANLCLWAETSIAPMEAELAAKRTRLFVKAASGSMATWIGPLTETKAPGSGSTWRTTTARWLAKNNNQLLVGKWKSRIAAKMVRKGVWRGREQDLRKTKGWKEYVENGLLESSGLFYRARRSKQIVKGVALLVRARGRALLTGRHAASMGLIESKYEIECMFCSEKANGETLHHLVVECEAWHEQRRSTKMEELIKRISDKVKDFKEVTCILLGGVVRGQSLMPEWLKGSKHGLRERPLYRRVAKFLQEVNLVRKQKLKALMKVRSAGNVTA